jgi:hypothetical protein
MHTAGGFPPNSRHEEIIPPVVINPGRNKWIFSRFGKPLERTKTFCLGIAVLGCLNLRQWRLSAQIKSGTATAAGS